MAQNAGNNVASRYGANFLNDTLHYLATHRNNVRTVSERIPDHHQTSANPQTGLTVAEVVENRDENGNYVVLGIDAKDRMCPISMLSIHNRQLIRFERTNIGMFNVPLNLPNPNLPLRDAYNATSTTETVQSTCSIEQPPASDSVPTVYLEQNIGVSGELEESVGHKQELHSFNSRREIGSSNKDTKHRQKCSFTADVQCKGKLYEKEEQRGAQRSIQRVDPCHKNYKKEEDRKSSFKRFGWSVQKPSPKELAKAGFFCIGNNRSVCFMCGIIFENWKTTDNPLQRHRIEVPTCQVANI